MRDTPAALSVLRALPQTHHHPVLFDALLFVGFCVFRTNQQVLLHGTDDATVPLLAKGRRQGTLSISLVLRTGVQPNTQVCALAS